MAKNDKKSATPAPDLERMKRLGARTETITIALSPTQVEDEKSKVCDLLARKDNIQAALKSIKTEYKAKLDAVDERIAVSRRAAVAGNLDLEVEIEEWLTRGNEVLRIRTDTGEQLGRRTARMEELQETMFGGDAPPAAGEEFPSSEAAFGDDIS